jgi:hypothetical protein
VIEAEVADQQAKVYQQIAERRARSAALLNKILAPLAIGTLITTREYPDQSIQDVADRSLHDGREYRKQGTHTWFINDFRPLTMAWSV